MIKTTLKDQGPRLPIGTFGPAGLLKDFSLRPFKSRIERHLGNWKEANGDKYNPGQLVAMQTAKFLSLIVARAGDKDLPINDDGDSPAAGELAIHKWHFSDVLYAYVFARVQSLGPQLEASVSCPMRSCGFSGRGQFDLGTLEVRSAEKSEELFTWIDIKRPFPLRDGNGMCRSVRVGPVTWASMTRPGVMSGNMSTIALASLQDSIGAINRKDEPYTLFESELDEMEKIDRVRIDKMAARVQAGVELSTDIPCPKCNAPITNPLDWTFDFFFGESLPLEISTS